MRKEKRRISFQKVVEHVRTLREWSTWKRTNSGLSACTLARVRIAQFVPSHRALLADSAQKTTLFTIARFLSSFTWTFFLLKMKHNNDSSKVSRYFSHIILDIISFSVARTYLCFVLRCGKRQDRRRGPAPGNRQTQLTDAAIPFKKRKLSRSPAHRRLLR